MTHKNPTYWGHTFQNRDVCMGFSLLFGEGGGRPVVLYSPMQSFLGESYYVLP